MKLMIGWMKRAMHMYTMPSSRASAWYWLCLVLWVHLDYANTILYFDYWSAKLLHTEQTISDVPNKAILWADFHYYVSIDLEAVLPYWRVVGWNEFLFYTWLIVISSLYLLLPLLLQLCGTRHGGRLTLAVDLLFLLGFGWLLGTALSLNAVEAGMIPIWLFYPLSYISLISVRLYQYRNLQRSDAPISSTL